jgi:hypothetical protein
LGCSFSSVSRDEAVMRIIQILVILCVCSIYFRPTSFHTSQKNAGIARFTWTMGNGIPWHTPGGDF